MPCGMGQPFRLLALQRILAARTRFSFIIEWPPKKVTRATLSLLEVFHRIGESLNLLTLCKLTF